MFTLKDRVAIVTGASQGIGRETALALARAGAKVAVAAQNKGKHAALATEISAAGGEALAVRMNVADAEPITPGDEVREPLVRQVCLPALWHESVHEMTDNAVVILLGAGLGKILSGLLRQTDSAVRCLNVEEAANLHSTMGRVAQARAEAPER
jgi:NAD(P)-dependent dehydrogenase (short-subunit alcohol dehydrogenase family)